MADVFRDLLAGERDAVLIAAAAYFALCGAFGLVTCLRMARWPSVIGHLHEIGVARAGVAAMSVDERDYAGGVRYSYQVAGAGYVGARLSPFDVRATHNLRFIIRGRLGWVERVGADGVRVHHHPRKPPQKTGEIAFDRRRAAQRRAGLHPLLWRGGADFGRAVMVAAASAGSAWFAPPPRYHHVRRRFLGAPCR